jgi:hypothetical protein
MNSQTHVLQKNQSGVNYENIRIQPTIRQAEYPSS